MHEQEAHTLLQQLIQQGPRLHAQGKLARALARLSYDGGGYETYYHGIGKAWAQNHSASQLLDALAAAFPRMIQTDPQSFEATRGVRRAFQAARDQAIDADQVPLFTHLCAERFGWSSRRGEWAPALIRASKGSSSAIVAHLWAKPVAGSEAQLYHRLSDCADNGDTAQEALANMISVTRQDPDSERAMRGLARGVLRSVFEPYPSEPVDAILAQLRAADIHLSALLAVFPAVVGESAPPLRDITARIHAFYDGALSDTDGSTQQAWAAQTDLDLPRTRARLRAATLQERSPAPSLGRPRRRS